MVARSLLTLGLAALSARAEHWAVLVAGSNGFWNYRHQADVCHAYKTLTEGGLSPERIITMLYDDAANDSDNPFRGKLFNKPAPSLAEAVDVYAGCKKDYTGDAVNPEKFLAVLTGNATAAGGRVLRSTAEDSVFVNFVDHGAEGLIAFPGDAVLHANKLVETLKGMHAKGMYKQLVFYLETCESGSMFEGLLPGGLPVYAVTAANAKESSWGTYCGDAAKIGNKTVGTCLGDLFSVNWLEDTDLRTAGETLGRQYERVKALTNKSHVMRFGEVANFSGEPISAFEGPGDGSNSRPSRPAVRAGAGSVKSREVKLQMLYDAFLRESSAEASQRLVVEIKERRAAKSLGESLATKVPGGAANGAVEAPALSACHERAVEEFGAKCRWTENHLQLSSTLLELCRRTAGEAAPVLKAVREACPAQVDIVV